MAATLPPRLYIDGHNLLHRAEFGFPARITSRSGRDITLVFGFFALLRAGARSLDTHPNIIVVFDGPEGANERRSLMPRYKPSVTDGNDEFTDLPFIHQGLELLGIPCIRNLRYEADDIIASFITQSPDREHIVMSTDKDFYQLLTDRVFTLNTQRRVDRRRIGPGEIYEKYGVRPRQWCDYRALIGDQADNIPGIRGIGPATARKLLADEAHLENLDRLDRLVGRTGALIRAQWNNLLLWRQLIKLRTDLPLPTVPDQYAPTLPMAQAIVGELGLWAR